MKKAIILPKLRVFLSFCNLGAILTKFLMPCVLLCGGTGTRMGRLKQELLLDIKAQETLADFQVKRLQQWFVNLYFSAKVAIPNAFKMETILDLNTKELPLRNARDLQDFSKEQFAPIFGLQSILEFLQCDVFVMSIDTPFLDYDSTRLILRTFGENHKPTFAKNIKIHPLLGVYTLESLSLIKEQITKKEYKLMRLLEKINAQFVEIGEDKTQNLNTPQEYQEALKQIQLQIKA